jgi:hypothetical protein
MSKPTIIELKSLDDFIKAAIYHDFLIAILITSASEGKLKNLGIDFGVGKSTLMMDLAYAWVNSCGAHFRLNPCETREQKWDRVFDMLHAFPYELEEFFYKAPKRYPGEPVFFMLDDIQRVFGKSRSRDNYVRSLRDRATTARPQLAVLFATAPDIGELAYPWRYFFNFEVKVCERGYYEVQRLKKWTMFDNPYQTMVRLDYKGEVSRQLEAETGEMLHFEALPNDIQDRYEKWREECNKRFDEGEGEWRLRSILNVLTDEAKELLTDLVTHGSYERQWIITGLNKGDELKLLLNCGLVEKFGDTVVPTKQARKMVKLV